MAKAAAATAANNDGGVVCALQDLRLQQLAPCGQSHHISHLDLPGCCLYLQDMRYCSQQTGSQLSTSCMLVKWNVTDGRFAAKFC